MDLPPSARWCRGRDRPAWWARWIRRGPLWTAAAMPGTGHSVGRDSAPDQSQGPSRTQRRSQNVPAGAVPSAASGNVCLYVPLGDTGACAPAATSGNSTPPPRLSGCSARESTAVVILSTGNEPGLRGIYVVPAAETDITGVAIELAVGREEGLDSGVVRVALARPDRINCSWLVSLNETDLNKQSGVLSEEKLSGVTRV